MRMYLQRQHFLLSYLKEPTHYSRSVGHEGPGVVPVFCECIAGYGPRLNELSAPRWYVGKQSVMESMGMTMMAFRQTKDWARLNKNVY